MQMSRSVITPITFWPSFMIGSTPQSFSHINFAASTKLSVSQIDVAFGVMISLTFMIYLLVHTNSYPIPATNMPRKYREFLASLASANAETFAEDCVETH